MKVTANATWKQGMEFDGTGWSGHTVAMDAGEEFGGKDRAARPFELVLVGLCGCTGMDVVSLLRKMRVDFAALDLAVEAEKSEEQPHVFTEINLTYIVRGNDIDEEKLKKAIELSMNRYCSVTAMLRKACPVNWTYRMEKV